jgi:putative peptide zinc metalloprotease protein
MPNLATRSIKYWASLIERRVFGVEKKSDPLRFGEHVWLLVFAPASYVYRMIVLFGISLFVATLYLVFGIRLALWRLFSGIAMPAAKIGS